MLEQIKKRSLGVQNKISKLILILSITIINKNDAQSCKTFALLTPRTSIETAYTNRPDLKRALYDIRARERLSRVALSGYLPQIAIEAGAGTAAPLSFFAPARFATLSFTQLLYSPAGPIEQFRIARQDTRALEWQRKILGYQIQFESETGILDLWLSQQEDTLVRIYDEVSKIVYNQQTHQFNLGLSDRALWLQHTTDFAVAQSRVKKYVDELTRTSSGLEKNLGIICCPDTPIDLQEMNLMIDQALASQKYTDIQTFFKTALSNRDELNMIDERIKQEIYWQRFYGFSYLPSISLYTNVIKYFYERTALSSGLFEGALASGWNAGIKFNWVFDGLANVFNKSVAGEREFSAMMDRIDMIAKIKKDVYTNFANLQTSLKDFKAAQQEYERAQNEIILNRKQHNVGLISNVDIQQQETLWLKAQHDFLTNKVTVAKQYRALMYSCGYPKSFNHNKVDHYETI